MRDGLRFLCFCSHSTSDVRSVPFSTQTEKYELNHFFLQQLDVISHFHEQMLTIRFLCYAETTLASYYIEWSKILVPCFETLLV